MAYQILLSKKDEFVPDTHVGLYSLMTNDLLGAKNEKLLVFKENETRATKLRLSTFNAVKKEFVQTTTFDFARFWNNGLDMINKLGYNHFEKNIGLRELLHLIDCFQVIRETPKYEDRKRIGTQKRKYISFGIDKKYLAPYMNSVIETGEFAEPPKYRKIGRTPEAPLILTNSFVIKLENENGTTTSVKGARTPIYERFQLWCKNQGVSRKQGLEMALDLLLKEYPVDNLPTDKDFLEKRFSPIDYVKVNVDDIELKEYAPGIVHRTINFKTQNMKIMLTMIRNFNKNLDVTKTGKLNLSAFLEMCFNHFCSTRKDFVLMYATPDKYKELMELKKFKEHNLDNSK